MAYTGNIKIVSKFKNIKMELPAQGGGATIRAELKNDKKYFKTKLLLLLLFIKLQGVYYMKWESYPHESLNEKIRDGIATTYGEVHFTNYSGWEEKIEDV